MYTFFKLTPQDIEKSTMLFTAKEVLHKFCLIQAIETYICIDRFNILNYYHY